ncbi:MAG TPA: hypothetical protein VF884_13810 [Nitrososphaeraceae archaeon]
MIIHKNDATTFLGVIPAKVRNELAIMRNVDNCKKEKNSKIICKNNLKIERKCGRFISFLAPLDLVQVMTQKRKVSLDAKTPICLLFLFYILIAVHYGLPFASAWNETSNDSKTSMNPNMINVTATLSNTSSPVPLSSPTIKSPTDGKSVDVMVQASPFPLSMGDSKFKITFLQPSSATVQVHVDYDVAISQLDKEVFRASALTGQPLLHTAEGIVTIPYKFEKPGHYTMQVSVLGINFIPIKTESIKFEFDIK